MLNPASESRLSQRIPVRCEAKLCYQHEDGSSPKIIKVQVLNMSASGVLVRAPKALPVSAKVRIQANELLVGTAYVRRTSGSSWRVGIGLEFDRAIQNRY